MLSDSVADFEQPIQKFRIVEMAAADERGRVAAPLPHCARIRNELDALRPPQVFHIWWHDHNLGAAVRQRLGRVEQVCDMVAERCLRRLLVSQSMGDLLEEPALAPADTPPVRS